MKHRIGVLAVLFALTTVDAQTPPPDLLNYQGVLRDASGAPVTGTVDVVFRLFDAPGAGNEILVDTHEGGGTGGVGVSGGLFNVRLGAGQVTDGAGAGTYTNLAGVFGDFSSVYLEVQIQGETLSPRTRIVASAYAHNAGRLEGASLTDIDSSISAQVGTHTSNSAAHHARYSDAEAVTAMGPQSNGNPLNHARLTSSEVVAIVQSAAPAGGNANAYAAVDDWGYAWDGIRRAPATWAQANANCQADGGRLPTSTELWRNNATTGTGNLADASAAEQLWTFISTSSVATRVTVRLSDGTTGTLAESGTAPYRCVWPDYDSTVIDGDNCHGEPGSGCEPFGLVWNIDRQDRPQVDFAAAVNECRFVNASVLTGREFEEAIQAGLPNPSNTYLWASDAKYWYNNNWGLTLVRWNSVPHLEWYYQELTLGYLSLPNASRGFRCIGKRSDSVGVAPAAPACNGSCFAPNGGASPLVADSIDRAPATQDVALETCRALGGALPYVDEFTELVHAGWPGGSNTFLWSSDPVYLYNGNYGYAVFRFDGTGSPAWVPGGGSTGTFWRGYAADSLPYRCVWHESLEATSTVCAANEIQLWDGAQFSCAVATPGDSGGNSFPGTDLVDAWGNAWDASERVAAIAVNAAADCVNGGGRLPTASELFRVRGNQSIVTPISNSPSYLWSTAPTDTAGQRVTVRLSDGAIAETAMTAPTSYRCIWPVEAGDVLAGPACYGEPGQSCFQSGGMRIDRYDRPAVPHATASFECRAVGGRLPDQGELQELIHGGAPNGSNDWVYLGETMYWYQAHYGYGVARWSGVGSTTWQWQDATGLVYGYNPRGFRCVFSDRVD